MTPPEQGPLPPEVTEAIDAYGNARANWSAWAIKNVPHSGVGLAAIDFSQLDRRSSELAADMRAARTTLELAIREALAPAQPAGDREAVTFAGFSAANLARCEAANGFNHKLGSWSLSDWFTAVLGELGEASNIAKKLNRLRDGITGNTETEEELRIKLRAEVADTFIYLDLLAQAAGFSLGEAVVDTFDRKSAKLQYPVALSVSPPPEQKAPQEEQKP